jgi:arginase family enzyme
MPLAHLLGYGDDGFIGLGTQTPVIRPEHLAIVAAQSWEPEEYDFLQRLGVRIYFQREIEKRGLETVLSEACERINKGTRATACSLDVDVIDPAEAAGFGSREAGGLSLEDLYNGLRWLSANQDFNVIEMVEYNPERDDTESRTAKVFEKALGILLSRNETAMQSA